MRYRSSIPFVVGLLLVVAAFAITPLFVTTGEATFSGDPNGSYTIEQPTSADFRIPLLMAVSRLVLMGIGAVRVHSPATRAADVAQAAMAAGADRLQGPQFEYERASEVRGELLGEAVADARGKAERLAAAAGWRLGRVDRIEETGPEGVPGLERAMAATAEPPDVRPRELTVTATVRVVFAFDD